MAARSRFGTREEYEAWRDGRGATARPVEMAPEPAGHQGEARFAEPQPSKLLSFATGWFLLFPAVAGVVSLLGVGYYGGELPVQLLMMVVPAVLAGVVGWFASVGLWRGSRDGYFYASIGWAYTTTAWSVGLLLAWSSLDSLVGPIIKMVISMAVLWGLLAQLRDLPPGTGSNASDPMGLRFVAAAALFGVAVAFALNHLWS